MSVDISFGTSGLNYTNVAGFCIQLGLSKESGIKHGDKIDLYAYVFIQKNPSQPFALPSSFGTDAELSIKDDGFDVAFPQIRFLDWSLLVDNKVALGVLRFGYTKDDSGYTTATTTTSRDPSMDGKVESEGELITKAAGVAILGQESRTQADYGHVIRVATECTKNVEWLKLLMEQNTLIQGDAKQKKKSKSTSFKINGKDLKFADAEFVELEIRYGLANLCSLPDIGSYKTNSAICEFPRLLDYDFQNDENKKTMGWLERIVTANGGNRQRSFTETLTWFSTKKASRSIDPRPPKLKA